LNPTLTASVEIGRAGFSAATSPNFSGLTSVLEVARPVEIGLTQRDCSNVAKVLADALRAALGGDVAGTRAKVAEAERILKPLHE
jgi:hypothetical protein